MSIKKAAEALLADLLKKGHFAAVPAKNLSDSRFIYGDEGPLDTEDRDYAEDLGFSIAPVQSVGYEEGVESPKIHIYTTTGRRVLKGAISFNNVEYEVESSKLGKMTVNPAMAANSNPVGEIYRKNGRIACGSSVAPAREAYSGTLGAFVKINEDVFAISNNHVFSACNHVEPGIPIMSPSNADSRQGFPPIDFSVHHSFIPLHSGDPSLMPPCQVDVALAQVLDLNKVSSWQGDDLDGYDTPSTATRGYTGLTVKKFGRTTGFTRGILQARTLPLPIVYKSNRFNGIVWFTDFWTVQSTDPMEPFSMPGDSGSLVVTEDGENAVGLIFAGSDTTGMAYMLPFEKISACIPGLSLLPAHNV